MKFFIANVRQQQLLTLLCVGNRISFTVLGMCELHG